MINAVIFIRRKGGQKAGELDVREGSSPQLAFFSPQRSDTRLMASEKHGTI